MPKRSATRGGWQGGYQQPFGQQQPVGQQQPFRQQQPFYQQQPFGQQQHFVPGFQGLQAFQPPSPLGGGLQPYELAQIVSTVTPIVAALIQSRSYQGHFGQYLPRAA